MVGDVSLGEDKGSAGNPDNALILAAIGTRRQFGRCRRNVSADYSEIAIFKLPNVGTALASVGLHAIGVRIRAKSFQEHAQNMTMVIYLVNRSFGYQ